MEPNTGEILRQTIRFVLMKNDFQAIKSWMNTNNKNYFEFFQRMPFYLLAPNGKIMEWYPKPNLEQKLSTDSKLKAQESISDHYGCKYSNI